jgi:hypothetical protein
MAVLALAARPSTGQRQDRGGAEEAVQTVVEEPDPQAMADQPRGHGIKDLAQREATGGGDADDGFLIIAGPIEGERPERAAFGLDLLHPAGVLLADDLINEPAIGGQIVKVRGPAQEQGVPEGSLKMAMGALDTAVLVGDPAVVAGRDHAVMGAQILVATGDITGGLGLEIAESRRQAVAAVLDRRAAEQPQGILQALGQGHEALAPQHDMGVLPA